MNVPKGRTIVQRTLSVIIKSEPMNVLVKMALLQMEINVVCSYITIHIHVIGGRVVLCKLEKIIRN